MKYKIIGSNMAFPDRKYEYIDSSAIQGLIDGLYGGVATFFRVSDQEFDLWTNYKVEVPETNPATGTTWIATQVPSEPAGTTSVGFDPARIEYAKNEIWKKEIQARADKGQEVQNAMELNALFREFVRDLMDETQFLIDGNLKDMNLRPTETIHQTNYEKHTKEWKAYKSILRSIIKFERGIAITTNIDPEHPVSSPDFQSMVNVVTMIKATEPELWTDLTKMLKVEEAYEPKAAVDTWIAVEQAANPHVVIHTAKDTDTSIVDSVVSGGTK